MARKERQWSVVERTPSPRRGSGKKYVRYYDGRGGLVFSAATRPWFEGQKRVDLLQSKDGAYAIRRNGTALTVGYRGLYVVLTRKGLTLPVKTQLSVYEDGDLLVIDPNGDA